MAGDRPSSHTPAATSDLSPEAQHAARPCVPRPSARGGRLQRDHRSSQPHGPDSGAGARPRALDHRNAGPHGLARPGRSPVDLGLGCGEGRVPRHQRLVRRGGCDLHERFGLSRVELLRLCRRWNPRACNARRQCRGAAGGAHAVHHVNPLERQRLRRHLGGRQPRPVRVRTRRQLPYGQRADKRLRHAVRFGPVPHRRLPVSR